MPILANPKQERFAQELAKGKSATDAMKAAGYCDARNSTRLTKNDEIAARVAELQERSSERAEITKDKLTAMYLEDRALAYRCGQASAARAATDSLSKLHGLLVNKVEVGNPGDFARMSDDELDGFIAERSRRVRSKPH